MLSLEDSFRNASQPQVSAKCPCPPLVRVPLESTSDLFPSCFTGILHDQLQIPRPMMLWSVHRKPFLSPSHHAQLTPLMQIVQRRTSRWTPAKAISYETSRPSSSAVACVSRQLEFQLDSTWPLSAAGNLGAPAPLAVAIYYIDWTYPPKSIAGRMHPCIGSRHGSLQ